jgi:hypothetical protein
MKLVGVGDKDKRSESNETETGDIKEIMINDEESAIALLEKMDYKDSDSMVKTIDFEGIDVDPRYHEDDTTKPSTKKQMVDIDDSETIANDNNKDTRKGDDTAVEEEKGMVIVEEDSDISNNNSTTTYEKNNKNNTTKKNNKNKNTTNNNNSNSNKWSDSQQKYIDSLKRKNSGRRWTSSVIQKALDIAWDMWEQRNDINNNSMHPRRAADMEKIKAKLRDLYAKGYLHLLQIDHHLFSKSVETLQLGEPNLMQQWIHSHTTATRRAEAATEDLARNTTAQRDLMRRWLE